MKLDDFINERLEKLHMTRTVLVNNYGLSWSILSNIKHDKPISAATKEKLALALQCSQGDIQACLAEMPDERRKKVSVMDAVDAIATALAAETVLKEAEQAKTGMNFNVIEVEKVNARRARAELKRQEDDNVNHPAHYTQGGIECIEAIRASMTPEEFRGYLKGCQMKYIWRYQLKGGAEDLKKARWYLDKLIAEVDR